MSSPMGPPASPAAGVSPKRSASPRADAQLIKITATQVVVSYSDFLSAVVAAAAAPEEAKAVGPAAARAEKALGELREGVAKRRKFADGAAAKVEADPEPAPAQLAPALAALSGIMEKLHE